MSFVFAIILVFLVSAFAENYLRGDELVDETKELFIQDVVFSILDTIYEGAEESRKSGNNHYRLFIPWQDEQSKLVDCSYCYYGLQNKEIRESTDDIRKYDYASDGFLFPTSANSVVPHYKLNKDMVLTLVMKQLVDLFSGVDVFLNNDSCCHEFGLKWDF